MKNCLRTAVIVQISFLSRSWFCVSNGNTGGDALSIGFPRMGALLLLDFCSNGGSNEVCWGTFVTVVGLVWKSDGVCSATTWSNADLLVGYSWGLNRGTQPFDLLGMGAVCVFQLDPCLFVYVDLLNPPVLNP